MIKFDKYTSFSLEVASGIFEKFNSLKNGASIVGQKEDYKPYDKDILRVDMEIENFIIGKIKEQEFNATILSEEVGIVQQEGNGKKLHFFIDPFDGSSLFFRGIEAFWYSTFSIYEDGKAKSSVVLDFLNNIVSFANEEDSYGANFEGGSFTNFQKIKVAGNKDLSNAYIATYLMKPVFMYPTITNFRELFEKCKFILPQGGPASFVDVARGKVDIYLAFKEAPTEVFTGLPIAEKSGCVITDFQGKPINFDTNMSKEYQIVCTANKDLHEEVLELIKGV